MKNSKNISFFYRFFNTPGNRDLYQFSRQLQSYLRTGQSNHASCFEIAKYTQNLIMKNAILGICKSLQDGYSLAESVSKQGTIFPNYCSAAIRAGESSGHISSALKHISEFLKQERNILRKINNALIPMKIISVFFVVALYVLANVTVPKYEKLYEQRRVALPFITKIVFFFVHLITDYWYIFFGLIVGLYFLWRWFAKTNPDLIDEWKIKIPLYNKVYYYIIHYRMATTLSMLLQSGMKAVEALELTANVIGNRVYGRVLRSAALKVVNGYSIKAALTEADDTRKFDPMIINFLATGEATGQMPKTLDEASETFKEDVDDEMEVFSQIISVFFLLPIAGGIVLLYIATFAPQLALFQTMTR